jgi:hypothetical protein
MKVIGVVGSGQMGVEIAQVAAPVPIMQLVEVISGLQVSTGSYASPVRRCGLAWKKNKTWFLSLRLEPENTDFFAFLNIAIL